MSNKAKNLTYEMEEPSFLRRLRQQHAGGGGPDRYIAPRNRKTAIDDEEDAPTYVLEGAGNETISNEEFKAMESGKGETENEGNKDPDPQIPTQVVSGGAAPFGKEDPMIVRKANVTDIGAKGKKRKATKIGGDDEVEEKEEKIEVRKGKAKAGKKAKKPVKLSFEQD